MTHCDRLPNLGIKLQQSQKVLTENPKESNINAQVWEKLSKYKKLVLYDQGILNFKDSYFEQLFVHHAVSRLKSLNKKQKNLLMLLKTILCKKRDQRMRVAQNVLLDIPIKNT